MRNHRIGRFTSTARASAGSVRPIRRTRARAVPVPLEPVALGDGTALVAEFQGCRVQRVNLETKRIAGDLRARGSAGRRAQQPVGHDALDDEIFLVDARNNRVVGFRPPS